MESLRPGRSAQRVWFAVSVALFVGAAYFVAIGYRQLHHWLLLAGALSNVMVFWLLQRHRRRAN